MVDLSLEHDILFVDRNRIGFDAERTLLEPGSGEFSFALR
jgi:hypothetical protein